MTNKMTSQQVEEAIAASKPYAMMDVKYAADRWKENR